MHQSRLVAVKEQLIQSLVNSGHEFALLHAQKTALLGFVPDRVEDIVKKRAPLVELLGAGRGQPAVAGGSLLVKARDQLPQFILQMIELRGVALALRRREIDAACDFENMADTAAVIEQLDLVISVDTSVAHLAGALGKPVWVLLAYVPDWRWMLDRSDTPWYPQMRLFRQPRIGDWTTPLRLLTERLGKINAIENSRFSVVSLAR